MRSFRDFEQQRNMYLFFGFGSGNESRWYIIHDRALSLYGHGVGKVRRLCHEMISQMRYAQGPSYACSPIRAESHQMSQVSSNKILQ